MDQKILLDKLLKAKTTSEIELILKKIQEEYGNRIKYIPVGGIDHDNNSGQINVGSDPGKGIVERLTNAIDAVVELEYHKHNGQPRCKNPRDAATTWLGVPSKGLYQLSSSKRGILAEAVQLIIEESDVPNHPNVQIVDKGIGISLNQMSKTILSLGSSNKLDKPYLMGAYGQGGSSTFGHCEYTIICSGSNLNSSENKEISFTVVFLEDLDPEKYKLGRYVYLTLDDDVFHAKVNRHLADYGTIVKHFEYDLTSYKAPLGPSSVYGLLQRALFDPVLPIKLDDRVHNYRRVIKGARNAFNAATDEEISEKGPNLTYNLPNYNISILDYGTIGLEYWVLQESITNKRYDPIKAYVDDKRPILFTLNGQTHAEFSGSLIRSDADLPFLRNRIVIHVDCNGLTPLAKRKLFSSTREDIRKNEISKIILDEIVKSLRSDDKLRSINEEAKNSTIRNIDANPEKDIQQEVVKLLRTCNFNPLITNGGTKNIEILKELTPIANPERSHILKKIDLHNPPTYVKILNESPVELYPGQRSYIRVETDAMSSYHNSDDLKSSKFNFIINGDDNLIVSGTTPLSDGRMRVILDCRNNAVIGQEGTCIIELHRFGLSTISDQMEYKVIEKPISKASRKEIAFPDIQWIPVDGIENETWDTLSWTHDINNVATSSHMSNGMFTVYYSTVFPTFRQHYERILKNKPTLAPTFLSHYKKLIALHSLLLENNEKGDTELEDYEKWEAEERCRFAILSCISAEQLSSGVVVLPEIE